MKNFIIIVLLFVVILSLFAFEKIHIPDDITEPAYIVESFKNGIVIESDLLIGYYTFRSGKVLYRLPNTIDNDIQFDVSINTPVYVFYDIYNTDTTTDINLYVLEGVYTIKKVEKSNGDFDVVLYLDKVYIPFESEKLFSNLTDGYDLILDSLKNEFNLGFPNKPEGDNVITYIQWFANSLYHSIRCVVISFDFVLYPINIYGGLLF